MSRRFHLVDVFAERRYAGNQLAVVVGADDLSDETMQQLAAETNYSETTFVNPAREHDDGYRVRIFTPAREIAFAGHPILGTAWVVRRHVAQEAADSVRAAFLGAYILEHRFLADSELDLRIEQGYEIRRPSLIMLRARMTGGSPEIRVGGQVIATVQGDLI